MLVTLEEPAEQEAVCGGTWELFRGSLVAQHVTLRTGYPLGGTLTGVVQATLFLGGAWFVDSAVGLMAGLFLSAPTRIAGPLLTFLALGAGSMLALGLATDAARRQHDPAGDRRRGHRRGHAPRPRRRTVASRRGPGAGILSPRFSARPTAARFRLRRVLEIIGDPNSEAIPKRGLPRSDNIAILRTGSRNRIHPDDSGDFRSDR